MPQRITSSEKADSILKQGMGGGTGNNVSLKDKFVDLKPDPATGVTEKTLRLVGFPISFLEHSPQIRSVENPKEYVKHPFTDGDLNRSFNRVCSENDEKYGACAWCADGYRKSKKFSWLCLERQDDGTSIVKILSKGTTIFEKFFDYEKFQRKKMAEAQAKGKQGHYCVYLGGLVGREVIITAESDKGALGGVKYAVNIDPEENTLEDSEIELLRAAGTSSAEQLKEMYEADPELKEMPEFFTFGYNLYNVHKYQAPRHEEAKQSEATPKSEIAFVAGGESENNTPSADATPAKTKAAAKAAPATNIFVATDDADADEAEAAEPVVAPAW